VDDALGVTEHQPGDQQPATHISSAARVRSVRIALRVNHKPAASSSNADGSSHEIWVPMSVPNNRKAPVLPHLPPPLPPPGPPPPTLPVSSPVSRPNPL